MRITHRPATTLLSFCCLIAPGFQPAFATNAPFEIQVVDQATGRGIPMVELKSVSKVRFVTDSAGRIALLEPGWFGRTLFFHVQSHGYTMPKDGFGFAGVRLDIVPGGKATVPLKRINIAERLYRVTGEGIYRDSALLEATLPLQEPLLNAEVTGQDSVQAAVCRDQLYWFWGDTDRARYPLGLFRTSGATSQLPARGGLDPGLGVNLAYFTAPDGFSRPMAHLGFERGLVWIDGLTTVPDAKGVEQLICHYSHLKSLGELLEHGLAVFNHQKGEFEKRVQLPLTDHWRHPHGHAVAQQPGGTGHVYFGHSFANVRVEATLEAMLDPARYESWSCLSGDGTAVRRNKDGKLDYRWDREADPVDAGIEKRLVKSKTIAREEARFLPRDIQGDGGSQVLMHRGTVRWNPYRNRWILIATEESGSSNFGEIWYAEAATVVGPWPEARKIVTHDRYSFYNPVHHPFFDQEEGRRIYFEGTYTSTFSGNPDQTPRYDYNQIMYRLDLDDERLRTPGR